MLSCRSRPLLRLALGLLSVASLPAADGPQYTIQTLGSFTQDAYAMSVNNAGTVVLQALYTNATTTGTQSFVWQGGTLTQLPTLASKGDVFAYGINNHNVVVGYALVPAVGTTIYHAVLWSGPSWTIQDLGTAGAVSAIAMSINDSGVVAGIGVYPASDGSGILLNQVIQWPVGSSGGLQLPTTTPYAARSWGEILSASAIGNTGTIVGYTSSGYATAWTHNAPSSLGTFGLASCSGGFAEVINANGVIGCDVYGGVASASEHLFRVQGSTSTALASLPTGLSPAYSTGHCNLRGINSSGDIVGDHYLPSQANDAALWTADGHVYDLNTQISGASSFQLLTTATGITDDGHIVGFGTTATGIQPYLLTLVGSTTSTGGATGTGTGSTGGATGSTIASGGGGGSSGGCGLGAGGLGLLAVLGLRLRRDKRVAG